MENINVEQTIAEKPKHSDFKCFLGVHKYDIYAQYPLMDARNMNIGVVIVNRCHNCGKVKDHKIHTIDVRF